MQWWREARFGLFIHWGLYAVPAGAWGGKANYGEWIRNKAQIPLPTYDKFVAQFNPVKFDAAAWVRAARDAGMKYIVITSKHHDGFAIFDSKLSDFDVMATPLKRDILKELAAACKTYGLKLCFYHSIRDWHHPDYLPRRPWEEKDRPSTGAVFDRYIAYMKAQLKELLTKYGEIGVPPAAAKAVARSVRIISNMPNGVGISPFTASTVASSQAVPATPAASIVSSTFKQGTVRPSRMTFSRTIALRRPFVIDPVPQPIQDDFRIRRRDRHAGRTGRDRFEDITDRRPGDFDD